ncbi:MAG: NFACT RNA binding domain-containing protein [Desulfonauticus sp.]|nr:NFACT RNA binding domain-containing protein [Desulfonauticus sp.]
MSHLKSKLICSRLEKIYNPYPELWTFRFSSKTFLYFYASRKRGFFVSGSIKLDNPATPSAWVMRLRKLFLNRFVKDVKYFWPRRVICLDFGEHFLKLEIGLQPEVVQEIQFDQVIWPELLEIDKKQDVYRDYPQITPPLRAYLKKLSLAEQKDFYQRLQQGKIDKFYVYEDKILLWPDQGKLLFVTQDLEQALNVWGELQLRTLVAHFEYSEKQGQARVKRLKKTLKKLEQDLALQEKRIQQEKWGRLLQENLYQLDKKGKLSEVCLVDENGNKVCIPLDKELTVLENMEKFFALARKGKRGLKAIEKRKKEIEQAILEANEQKQQLSQIKEKKIYLPKKYQGLQVSVFVSSDGFLILRGKNSQANHKLLTMASDFDFWFHVKNGQGAHVILRRDNKDQFVPEKSLKEAACLAALASFQKHSDRAEVMCTEVKYVRKAKGLAPGQVLVDKVLHSFRIEIDQNLEQRLKWK